MIRNLAPALLACFFLCGPAYADQGQVEPEKKEYYTNVYEIVSKNWKFANVDVSDLQGCQSIPVRLAIEPDGQISAVNNMSVCESQELVDTLIKAVNKSSPLPALPPVFEGRRQMVEIIFHP